MSKVRKFAISVFPLIVAGFLIWIGFESWKQGASKAQWLPEITFAILYPLAFYVPYLSNKMENKKSYDDSFHLWDGAVISVYILMVIVSLIFVYVGYIRFIVVVTAVLGLIGMFFFISSKTRE